ncbi:VTT domain-containing protein [Patescibacteria group bacterium]|nr:VTT domain-containing protein [Patescibacteria group bacterium]
MESLVSQYGYIGIFVISFITSTIIPMLSEGLLGLGLAYGLSFWGCIFSITGGNCLGATFNYLLGYFANVSFVDKLKLINKAKIDKYKNLLEKFGGSILFFTFIPGIGDPLTMAAGLVRVRPLYFFIPVFTGRFLRYILLAYLFSIGINLFHSYFA